MSYVELSEFLRNKNASIRLTKQDFWELEKNISKKCTCQKKVFGIYCVRSRFYPDNFVYMQCICNYFAPDNYSISEWKTATNLDKFDTCYLTQSECFGDMPIFTENYCLKCHVMAINKYLKGELALYNDRLYTF